MGLPARTRQRGSEGAWKRDLTVPCGGARPRTSFEDPLGDHSTGRGGERHKEKHVVALANTSQKKLKKTRGPSACTPACRKEGIPGGALSAKTALAGVVDDGPS